MSTCACICAFCSADISAMFPCHTHIHTYTPVSTLVRCAAPLGRGGADQLDLGLEDALYDGEDVGYEELPRVEVPQARGHATPKCPQHVPVLLLRRRGLPPPQKPRLSGGADEG
eukprot:450119-Rhodomonas_salina.1